jgi:tetratricopeptide (TPR) repeat protein
MERQDFAAALSAWALLRERLPSLPAGYLGAGSLLRQLGRLHEADAVLAEGMRQSPPDVELTVAYAWVAHSLGALVDADTRWQAVRHGFPDRFDGYYGGGSVLCALRRFDEADAVYRAAFGRFPMAAHLLADFAAVADARGDREEAARRWTTLRTLFPQDTDGYLREARGLAEAGRLDDAEAALTELLRRVPAHVAALGDRAVLAERRGRWSEALKRWDAVTQVSHGSEAGYVGAARALTELGRYADAHTVLQPALRLYPESLEVATLDARIAQARADRDGALQRFESMRRRFPQHPAGYIGGIDALLALGEIAQALDLSAAAVAACPNDLGIAMQSAVTLERAQQWDAALRRWGELAGRFPGQAAASVGLARSLMRADRAVEAEARWREAMERYPAQADGFLGLGELLRQAGRLDEAEDLLTDAVARFPDHLELERQRALTATVKRNWPVALARWETLKRRYPDHSGVRDGITDALWHATQDLGVAQSEAAAAPFEIPPLLLAQGTTDAVAGIDAGEDPDALREFFMGFESLGDTCEFGMVQRRFGAEPISLLRWTSTGPEHLAQAFETDFAGVGEPEFTVVQASAHGEYTTLDRRYHMFAHTFTQCSVAPLEKFTAQHLKRMQYLRRKLLEDVATGEKIFVYKSDRDVTEAQAQALFASLRRFGGPLRLLCVRLADAEHACGDVVAMGEGLYLGFIDRFSTVDIHVAAWLDLCRKTLAMSVAPNAGV